MFKRLCGWRHITVHVVTTIVTVAAFFTLLWITVFLVGIAPDRAFILSLLTFVLIGTGIMFTTSTFKRDRDEEV